MSLREDAKRMKDKHRTKNNEIDLSLSVLCATAERDQTLSTYDIANVCGCSQVYISEITRTALKKLRGNIGNELRDYYVSS